VPCRSVRRHTVKVPPEADCFGFIFVACKQTVRSVQSKPKPYPLCVCV
jgi:hypothetical protein